MSYSVPSIQICEGSCVNTSYFWLGILLLSLWAVAQTVETSVCDILGKPSNFDGKIVRVKATVAAGFDEFIAKGSGCGLPINAIWLAYPEGTKVKAGPVATLRLISAKNGTSTVPVSSAAEVKLDKSKDFASFDSYLSTPAKLKGVCPGCVKYTVTATLTGRIDSAKGDPVVRDVSGNIIAINGFGNLSLYPVRLVLQSVTEVVAQEIDYTKNPAALKDDSGNSVGGDPVVAAHQAAKAFGAGSVQADELEAAAAAFGKEGEDNGVIVGFGATNEIVSDGAKGKQDSPDGILYYATFDMDRLKGAALSEAISHVGSEIADLRRKKGGDPSIFELETNAWQITVLSAVARGQKTLTAPGGYVMWNSTWKGEERGKLASDAMSGYLHDWAALGK